MYKYLYENDIRMRGHALAWDERKVEHMPGYETATYEEKYDYLLQECTKETWLFRGLISAWDVLNEPLMSNNFRYFYGTQAYSDIFKMAKALDPTCALYLNDTGMGNDYALKPLEERTEWKVAQIAKNMKENERAPIDGLGVQGHSGQYNYPQVFYKSLDLLSEYADEVSVTEFVLK